MSVLGPVWMTGASGRVGSRVFELLGDSLRIVRLDRNEGFDLLEPESFRRAAMAKAAEELPRAIVNLAAFTDVSAAYRERGDRSGPCYRINVCGTEAVARVARDCGVRLLQCSTDFVFDGKTDALLAEDAPVSPIEWYGETKLAAEEIAASIVAKSVIFRVAFPYRRTVSEYSDVVKNFRSMLSSGKSVSLFCDQWITPTCIDDIASAVRVFVEDGEISGLFHVTGPSPWTPLELGKFLAGLEDRKIDQIVPTRLSEYSMVDPRPRQTFLKIDSSKFCQYLRDRGEPPPRSVEAALDPTGTHSI